VERNTREEPHQPLLEMKRQQEIAPWSQMTGRRLPETKLQEVPV
jgi:hypothetical protein